MGEQVFHGIGIVDGIVTGQVWDFFESAKDRILVVNYTNGDMVKFVRDCLGVVTREGGPSSHAAIYCRMLRKPCVVGVNYKQLTNEVTMNGKTGEVIFHERFKN